MQDRIIVDGQKLSKKINWRINQFSRVCTAFTIVKDIQAGKGKLLFLSLQERKLNCGWQKTKPLYDWKPWYKQTLLVTKYFKLKAMLFHNLILKFYLILGSCWSQ